MSSGLNTIDAKDIDFLDDEDPTNMLATFNSSDDDSDNDLKKGSIQVPDANELDIDDDDPLHVLSLVEKNEKMNEMVPDDIIQNS